MPRLTALHSALLLASAALAQINAPGCSTSWEWSFNSLGQNACTVAAYLMATCNGGSFTVPALQTGNSYTGPSGADDGNLCKCNTVVYNLISACDACQGSTWITWSQFSANCTKTEPPSSFPNPVPAGTSVQKWALLDPTPENNWDASTAFSTGDLPEVAAGTSISGSGTSSNPGSSSNPSVSSPSASGFSPATPSGSGSGSDTSPRPSSIQGHKSSNTGAIVGGAVGGVVAAALAAIGFIFWWRRRQQQQQAPSAAFVVDPVVGNEMAYGGGTGLEAGMAETKPSQLSAASLGQPPTPEPPTTPMKLYDPSDPTTFPGYQPPQQPASPGGATTNSLATLQTTAARPPAATGYHGLPTV
ncbi:hypothetical protein BC834DRAFT_550588 [Gloeopeniophorella convolvens]|nr:hypothetical protein BC834DRAFT_550588 [Gloeopeniophorella convolvens]